jgi:magnesium chelatase family protein
MIAAIPSAVLIGVDGHQVSVEVHVSNGLPGFTVVGLPDAAVRESRDRVRAALLSSGLAWPLRRVTVNLAPSGVRKGGAGLDLPIAIGVLVASGVLDSGRVSGMAFVGELGLDGSLRGVPGTVVLAEALHDHQLVVAAESAGEASVAGHRVVRSAPALGALVDRLSGRRPWSEVGPKPSPPWSAPIRIGDRPLPRSISASECTGGPEDDLSDVRGHRLARRALEVAAAGGHHLLMVGPPGSGKSMLANRLPGILPRLDRSTALAVTRVHSAAGFPLPSAGLIEHPPFRSPHHGTPPVAMIGGGSSWMRPGEISLSHGGVLFLDELGEFPTAVLDAMRQPIEDGQVRVSRARGSTVFPARFILVAAMNPCPCGEGGSPGACRCSDSARERYARRLSAPLLDRFDIAIRVDRPHVDDLIGRDPVENSAAVAGRVSRARCRALERGVSVNAQLVGSVLDEAVPLTSVAASIIEKEVRSGSLSARGMHRVRRLARTLADLDDVGHEVGEPQVREALLLRCRRDLLLGGQTR